VTRTPRTTGKHTPLWGNRVVGIHPPLYCLTNGLIGHHLGHQRTLSLTTRGRRLGMSRTTPLTYMTDGPDSSVVASNWGSDQFPARCYNLVAHAQVQVRIRSRRFQARAVVASPKERARLWEQLKTEGPQYQHHQALTTSLWYCKWRRSAALENGGFM
jgi:deazaflavin-dependent oxidoreductase (nitroreductase family)